MQGENVMQLTRFIIKIVVLSWSLPVLALDLPADLERPLQTLETLKANMEERGSLIKGYIAKPTVPNTELQVINSSYSHAATIANTTIDKMISDIQDRPEFITKDTYRRELSQLNDVVDSFGRTEDIIYSKYGKPAAFINYIPIVIETIAGVIQIYEFVSAWREDARIKNELTTRLEASKWQDFDSLPAKAENCGSVEGFPIPCN